MYCIIVGLNLLILVACWHSPTILALAVLVNVLGYIEKRTALATRHGRR
jgi:hypothetical protein